jgi:hypothetical protein
LDKLVLKQVKLLLEMLLKEKMSNILFQFQGILLNHRLHHHRHQR